MIPREIWPDAIKQAYSDALIDANSVLETAEVEEYLEGFASRWGRISVDTFKQVLQHGNAKEKTFTLFALGYLAPPEGDILLTPFLDSPIRKERWASAISLGKHQKEHVFAVLLDLLIEDLEYHPPSLTAGEKPNELLLMKTWEKELERKDSEYVWEYDWCLHHRLKITLLLGSWGDPRAIPVLIQALQRSLELEFSSAYPNNFHIFSQTWHQFQDHLAYALGQLGAWTALDTLDLPPKRLHIARRYLVFGSLHASVPWVFDNIFLRNWGEEEDDIIGSSFLFARKGADPTLGLPDLASVNQVFKERFFLTQEEQIPSFYNFSEWRYERNDEWYDRWDAERSRTSETKQSE